MKIILSKKDKKRLNPQYKKAFKIIQQTLNKYPVFCWNVTSNPNSIAEIHLLPRKNKNEKD